MGCLFNKMNFMDAHEKTQLIELLLDIGKKVRFTRLEFDQFDQLLKYLDFDSHPAEDEDGFYLSISYTTPNESKYWDIGLDEFKFKVQGYTSVYEESVGSDHFTTYDYTHSFESDRIEEEGRLIDFISDLSLHFKMDDENFNISISDEE